MFCTGEERFDKNDILINFGFYGILKFIKLVGGQLFCIVNQKSMCKTQINL